MFTSRCFRGIFAGVWAALAVCGVGTAHATDGEGGAAEPCDNSVLLDGGFELDGASTPWDVFDDVVFCGGACEDGAPASGNGFLVIEEQQAGVEQEVFINRGGPWRVRMKLSVPELYDNARVTAWLGPIPYGWSLSHAEFVGQYVEVEGILLPRMSMVGTTVDFEVRASRPDVPVFVDDVCLIPPPALGGEGSETQWAGHPIVGEYHQCFAGGKFFQQYFEDGTFVWQEDDLNTGASVVRTGRFNLFTQEQPEGEGFKDDAKGGIALSNDVLVLEVLEQCDTPPCGEGEGAGKCGDPVCAAVSDLTLEYFVTFWSEGDISQRPVAPCGVSTYLYPGDAECNERIGEVSLDPALFGTWQACTFGGYEVYTFHEDGRYEYESVFDNALFETCGEGEGSGEGGFKSDKLDGEPCDDSRYSRVVEGLWSVDDSEQPAELTLFETSDCRLLDGVCGFCVVPDSAVRPFEFQGGALVLNNTNPPQFASNEVRLSPGVYCCGGATEGECLPGDGPPIEGEAEQPELDERLFGEWFYCDFANEIDHMFNPDGTFTYRTERRESGDEVTYTGTWRVYEPELSIEGEGEKRKSTLDTGRLVLDVEEACEFEEFPPDEGEYEGPGEFYCWDPPTEEYRYDIRSDGTIRLLPIDQCKFDYTLQRDDEECEGVGESLIDADLLGDWYSCDGYITVRHYFGDTGTLLKITTIDYSLRFAEGEGGGEGGGMPSDDVVQLTEWGHWSVDTSSDPPVLTQWYDTRNRSTDGQCDLALRPQIIVREYEVIGDRLELGNFSLPQSPNNETRYREQYCCNGIVEGECTPGEGPTPEGEGPSELEEILVDTWYECYYGGATTFVFNANNTFEYRNDNKWDGSYETRTGTWSLELDQEGEGEATCKDVAGRASDIGSTFILLTDEICRRGPCDEEGECPEPICEDVSQRHAPGLTYRSNSGLLLIRKDFTRQESSSFLLSREDTACDTPAPELTVDLDVVGPWTLCGNLVGTGQFGNWQFNADGSFAVQYISYYENGQPVFGDEEEGYWSAESGAPEGRMTLYRETYCFSDFCGFDCFGPRIYDVTYEQCGGTMVIDRDSRDKGNLPERLVRPNLGCEDFDPDCESLIEGSGEGTYGELAAVLLEFIDSFGTSTPGAYTLEESDLDPSIFAILDLNADGLLSIVELQIRAGTASPIHDADTNADGTVTLGELLRLIQLYNAFGYTCDLSTEDGFAPVLDAAKGLVLDCPPHAADYIGGDGIISLSELLRLVQLYNIGTYYRCAEDNTDDGFCLGPQ